MKKLAKVLAAVLVLSMILGVGAVSAFADGKLVLGTSADYPPFEFMYLNENNEMVYGGIDVAAAGYIAEQLGKELVVENMSFDYLLVALAKGDYDIVMAAIEDTPERENAADFSDPYYTDMPAMILARAADAEQYKTLKDFAGKVVGAQTATTKEDIVRNDMEGAELVSIQNINDLVNQLVYNKIDAVVMDGAVAMSFAESNSDLVVVEASSELGEAAPYCVAVAKGDPKGLLPGINEAIAKMMEEKVMDGFIEAANALKDSGEAIEVSVDAPEEG
ncbi:MAG: transporter substrate-binding domain-containing protein [Oscillospiraceae bacterium]|nr:transporter substrate-binding domain-containing protein [Oscillospiraceae bacterium]